MKKYLALACALITPGLLFSAEKPDGVLGTNMVSVSALYSNIDLDYYDSGDLDFAGIDITMNQNLAKTKSCGVDLNMSYTYMTNQNYTNEISMDSRQFILGATIYRDGMISPFFRPIVGYVNEKVEGAGIGSETADTWIYGGQIGVELHLMRGLSLTPIVGYYNGSDDNYTSETIVGLGANYWFGEHLGMLGSVEYSNQEHISEIDFSLGMAMHY